MYSTYVHILQVGTVIELTEDSSGYSAFWGLYSCTVLLSVLFVLRECLELVALGPRIYLSSGTTHTSKNAGLEPEILNST